MTKKKGIFYGWWIVIATMLISIYLNGIVVYGFTAFFEPIASEFGWNHAQVAMAASIRGLETGLMAPLAGYLFDRIGPKRIIFTGILIVALGITLLSTIHSLAAFYGSFVLISVGMSACSTIVLVASVGSWFRRRVGMAMGLTMAGAGISGLLVPVIVSLIHNHGWRAALVILAIGMVILVLPLSFIFRHRPEDYGYEPDGGPGPQKTNSILAPSEEPEITVRQAVRTTTFWMLALTFFLYGIVTNAIVVHIMPFLSEIGMALAGASLIATAVPLVSTGGRFGFGWLGDKTERKNVAAVCFLMMAVGIVFFSIMTPAASWAILGFVVIFSLGYGGGSSMRSTMVRGFFGRKHFGAVFGLCEMGIMLGSFIGAPLAGWVYDTWGSYRGVWMAFIPLCIVITVLALSLPTASRSPANARQS